MTAGRRSAGSGGGSNYYFVLLGFSYESDLKALRVLLGREAAYIGVIGSKRRIATVKRVLEREGVEKGKTDRLWAPVGIEIEAQSPAEIAVSIAAEIVAVRNGLGRPAGSISRPGGG